MQYAWKSSRSWKICYIRIDDPTATLLNWQIIMRFTSRSVTCRSIGKPALILQQRVYLYQRENREPTLPQNTVARNAIEKRFHTTIWTQRKYHFRSKCTIPHRRPAWPAQVELCTHILTRVQHMLRQLGATRLPTSARTTSEDARPLKNTSGRLVGTNKSLCKIRENGRKWKKKEESTLADPNTNRSKIRKNIRRSHNHYSIMRNRKWDL